MVLMNLFVNVKKATKAVDVNKKSTFASPILANMGDFVKLILTRILVNVNLDSKAKIVKSTSMIVYWGK